MQLQSCQSLKKGVFLNTLKITLSSWPGFENIFFLSLSQASKVCVHSKLAANQWMQFEKKTHRNYFHHHNKSSSPEHDFLGQLYQIELKHELKEDKNVNKQLPKNCVTLQLKNCFIFCFDFIGHIHEMLLKIHRRTSGLKKLGQLTSSYHAV